jgi:hypothetical protein
MENPVVFPLLNPDGEEDFTISSTGTQSGKWQEDLEGLLSLGLYARFAPGTASSGARVQVYIQTSFAGGAAFDIACLTFSDVTESKAANLSANTSLPTATLTDGELADDTTLDGPIGDRVRAVVVVDGDYSGPTTLSVRGNAR